jgi:uncharacterized protein (TIGR03083 family)
MSLSPVPPTDTRALFRPVSSALVTLLRGLPPDDWDRPTIAGAWAVRDVAAHLTDLACRRLSFHRDRMLPRPPSRPIASERDFVDFINGLNAEWVNASRRLSPRVLTEVLALASVDLADWFEALPLDAPALFGVSWAGEQTSEGWFDVGREFVELWHHQEQIRLAVGASSLGDSRYLRAVLEIAVRGLPHAFRDVQAPAGQTLVFDVSGDSGATWTLLREAEGWTLHAGSPEVAATCVRLPEGAAWRLLFNALGEADAQAAMRIDGKAELARPLLRARAVIV